MALLYTAQLNPTKIELLRAWLPSCAWFTGPADAVEAVGAFRFDDPADEVGIETHLVSAGDGALIQAPLTYRPAPLEGAEDALVGTLQHSVLGQRWVYDACFDPVYVTALATAILTGGTQAELRVQADDGTITVREPTTWVSGSGTPGAPVAPITQLTVTSQPSATTIGTDGLELVVLRSIDGAARAAGELTLTGTWLGHDHPSVLAVASTR